MDNKENIHFNTKQVTEEQKNIIIKTYVELQKGIVASGKAAGVGERVAKRILKENNIKIRTFGEAATCTNLNNRKYTINDKYFQVESANMAYILGFLAADGCIRKKSNEVKIGLSVVDYDFLCMIRDELQSNKEVKKYTTNNGFDCCTFSFSSQQIKKDLQQYNITPEKTFNLTFPTKLDRKYWIDYIRGYFDGDGSVSTSGNNAIKFQICAAIPNVLQFIVDFFQEEYNIPAVKVTQTKNNLWNICYSINSTKKIYTILYTEDSLFLPRKKEKYTKLIQNKTK